MVIHPTHYSSPDWFNFGHVSTASSAPSGPHLSWRGCAIISKRCSLDGLYCLLVLLCRRGLMLQAGSMGRKHPVSKRVRNHPLALPSQQLYHYFTTGWFVQAPPWPLAGLSDYTSASLAPTLPPRDFPPLAHICSKPVYFSPLSPTH